MTDFLITKIIVSITALLFISYIFFRLTNVNKIQYYEKKINYLYYSHKLVFILFIILLIVGLVFYRIEKNVLIRKKTIEEYKFAMALLAYQIQLTSLNLNDEQDIDNFNNKKNVLKNYLKNELKTRYNKKDVSSKVIDCEAGGICQFVLNKNKAGNVDIDKLINQELKLFQYLIQNNSIRSAIQQEDWDAAIIMLNEELMALYPNITKEELLSGIGSILGPIVSGKPIMGFASLLSARSR